MKMSVSVVLVIIGLAFVFLTLKKGSGGKVIPITPQEAYGEIRNDFAILVDVREADEVQGGIAQPAHWIPTSKIASNDADWQAFVDKLPKDKKIIFYCAMGGRAQRAATLLAEKGFRTANMGGYSDWLKAGLPVKKP